MSNIESSVENVKRAWIESSYYENAEQWTPIFWGGDLPFRSYFNELDVRVCAELACGHGRHAERLLKEFDNRVEILYCLDIIENNIEKTKQRLRDFKKVSVSRINGKNFLPIPDGSLTGVFSYDAMVHFSPDIVKSYISDLSRVLLPGGKALFHHSNLNAPDTGRDYGANPHARNHMTEEIFREFVSEANLVLLQTEAFAWGHIDSLDRISLIQRP